MYIYIYHPGPAVSRRDSSGVEFFRRRAMPRHPVAFNVELEYLRREAGGHHLTSG